MTARLIVGCGYLGQRVARLWRDAGDTVHVVTRSAERAARLAAERYSPIVANVADRASLAGLPEIETVLYAVGFDRSAGLPMRQVYVDGLRSVLDALQNTVQKLIYISSTGVYGQTDGGTVNEDSPARPQRENGIVCLEAEQTLLASPLGGRSIILRLAGIYGPGRIPRRDALLAGEPIPAADEGSLNLIHVDDAARIVLIAAEHATPPRLYLVSDGHPVPRREYYAELAELVGAPPPRFAPPPSGSPAAQRGTSDKQIDNARLLAELPISLRYLTYREGLRDCVTRAL